MLHLEVLDILEEQINFKLLFEDANFVSVDHTLLDSISIKTEGYIFIDPLIETNFVINDPVNLELPR